MTPNLGTYSPFAEADPIIDIDRVNERHEAHWDAAEEYAWSLKDDDDDPHFDRFPWVDPVAWREVRTDRTRPHGCAPDCPIVAVGTDAERPGLVWQRFACSREIAIVRHDAGHLSPSAR